jgi:hypothetical protein
VAVTIQVQSVLYETPLDEIWRFMRGLEATVRAARSGGHVSDVSVRLGDCSSSPALSDSDVDELRSLLAPMPGVSLSYWFFNENRMTARGHNSLAEGATADFLMVVNPDTYASPQLLGNLVKAMADKTVGVSEARQIPIEHPKAYDQRTGETSWASTCCVLIRRSVFEHLGGFDQKFFPLYCDDVDFSWRVRQDANKVVFVPTAPVFHDKRLSTGGRVQASAVEQYYGAFARLMLARRYNRPDIEKETRLYIEKFGEEPLRRALRDFNERDESGDVPAAMFGGDKVAEFVNGEYAVHRY